MYASGCSWLVTPSPNSNILQSFSSELDGRVHDGSLFEASPNSNTPVDNDAVQTNVVAELNIDDFPDLLYWVGDNGQAFKTVHSDLFELIKWICIGKMQVY